MTADDDLAGPLTELAALHAGGILTDDEYALAKASVLNTDSGMGSDVRVSTPPSSSVTRQELQQSADRRHREINHPATHWAPVTAVENRPRQSWARRNDLALAFTGGTPVLALAGMATSLALAGVASFVLASGSQDWDTQTTASTVSITTSVARTPDSSVFRPSPTVASAQEILDQQVAADQPDVENLVGSWIPQLSAKRAGTAADGVVYDHDDIRSHYAQLRQRFPASLLLWSGDYATFRQPDFYVTVMAVPFDSADAALSWCVANGLGPNDCFAKRLAHTGGPEGNTTYQRPR